MKNLLVFLTLFFSVFTLTAQNVDLKRGLVAYYPFNGNANDESGNGNHGTVNGANLTSDRNGINNSSYNFNGINDYITASFQNINTIAVSFWFRSPIQSNDYSTLIDCKKKFYCMVLGPSYKYTSGKVFYRANLEDDIYSDLIYNDNKWHHIYIDFDNNSGKQKMYINGVFIKSNSINKIGYLSKIYFGCQESYFATSFFKGNIDDIHIYNRILNENEIQMLFKTMDVNQTISLEVPSSNIDVFDPISKIDLFGVESCVDAKVLSSADEKFFLVQQTGTKFEVYETEKWKSIGTFSIPNKKNISLAYSYFTSDRIYLSINDSDGEKYFNVSIYGGEVDEIKCKKTPRGCLGNNQSVSNYYYNSSKYQFDINGFRLSFKKSNSCFIEITKQNPEKVAYSSSINGSIDDCIKFITKYPNSDFKEKVETAMLAKAKNLDGLGELCKKHSAICTKAEQLAFDMVKNASKADKQKFLSIFPSGANFKTVKAQVDKMEEEEKKKLEAEKRKQEEERIKQEEERKGKELEEQKRIEEQKVEQARLAKKEQERRQKIQTNSNSSHWSLGSKVCNELNSGIVVGVLNQWNENKSSALIKVLSAPSSSKYEGENLYEDATIWIGTSGKGWHLCLDDEFDVASSQKTDSKVSSTGNSENSGTTGKRGTSATASKYAKLFMKNTYNDCNDDDKSGFSSRILSWETVDFRNQDGYCYAVRIEFGWDCGPTCGRKFEGVLIFEESGCSALFLVEKKTEVMGAIVFSMGLRSLCEPINDKEATEQFNQHFKGDFKWMMAGECIDE